MKEIARRVGVVVVELNEDDLNMIVNGLAETREALKDREFEARTGYQPVEWRRFMDEVLAITRSEG